MTENLNYLNNWVGFHQTFINSLLMLRLKSCWFACEETFPHKLSRAIEQMYAHQLKFKIAKSAWLLCAAEINVQ